MQGLVALLQLLVKIKEDPKGFLASLIPLFLGGAVYTLSEIKKELGEINMSLAIVLTKVDQQDKRISKLEDWVFRP